MTCPYCAEDIKNEVFVCPQCKRDLMFFKPVEQRLQAFDKELAALNECVRKMAARLDRRLLGEEKEEDKDEDPPRVLRIKKPTLWRMLGVVFIQFLLVVAVGGVFFAIETDIRPKYLETPTNVNWSEQEKQLIAKGFAAANHSQIETFQRREAVLSKVFLASLFALPIALGLWVGFRWRGRNLKRYLLVGLLCGLIDGAIILTAAILVAVNWGHYPGQISFALLFIVIDLFRCIFGFATGGLLGDWLEKRRYPQLYGRGFSDLLELNLSTHGDRLSRFGRVTRGLGSFTSSVGPLVPLLGVIITSVFGFYAAVAAKTAADLNGKNKPAASASPSPPPR